MAPVGLESVTKVYRRDVVAVDDLSLKVKDGELLVLVGPSGCGKSTALRLIAGLEDTTRGQIRIGDRVVTELSPKDRDVAMVFQGAATFPYMTVAENMGFGLKLRGRSKKEIKAGLLTFPWVGSELGVVVLQLNALMPRCERAKRRPARRRGYGPGKR